MLSKGIYYEHQVDLAGIVTMEGKGEVAALDPGKF
jgi:hypothetical protein